MLPERDFLRIHRSYVISVASVISFSRSKVEIKGTGVELPIGAQYASKVLEILSK